MERWKGVYKTHLGSRSEFRNYIRITVAKAVIQYWNLDKSDIIGHCTTAHFNEHETINIEERVESGPRLTRGFLSY